MLFRSDFLRPRELNVRSPRLYRRFLRRRRDCTAGKPASAFRPVSVPCPVILTSQHRLGSATSLLYPLATEKASLRVYYFEKKWLYACCSPCGSQRATRSVRRLASSQHSPATLRPAACRGTWREIESLLPQNWKRATSPLD